MFRHTLFLLLTIYFFQGVVSETPVCLSTNANTPAVCLALGAAHGVTTCVDPNKPPTSCALLSLTTHCCKQFCLPNTEGVCDDRAWAPTDLPNLIIGGTLDPLKTGACFCNAGGSTRPNACNTFFADSPNADQTTITACKVKCLTKPTGCVQPAYVTEGFNKICLCYCEPVKG